MSNTVAAKWMLQKRALVNYVTYQQNIKLNIRIIVQINQPQNPQLLKKPEMAQQDFFQSLQYVSFPFKEAEDLMWKCAVNLILPSPTPPSPFFLLSFYSHCALTHPSLTLLTGWYWSLYQQMTSVTDPLTACLSSDAKYGAWLEMRGKTWRGEGRSEIRK